MVDVIIRAIRLGKKYLIGHEAAPRAERASLAETARRRASKIVQRVQSVATGRQIVSGDEVEAFWALQELSFDIKRGDIVGIIGRNGAGKSTLLKILSRITEPTLGRVEIRGRVGSLLEVGTGFHGELTGRENVFLNGAILGMSRTEIRMKFDEIVEFSGVEQFIDTPVKRYSSGMYMRLAFAVAAHLEPEILIVDEVLAVGDAEFQAKCIGKMRKIADNGRTVLFVSHDIGAIASLCNSALYLKRGRLIGQGSVNDIIGRYGKDVYAVHSNEYIAITPILLGEERSLQFRVGIGKLLNGEVSRAALVLVNPYGVRVGLVEIGVFINRCLQLGKAEFAVSFELPALIPGEYRVDAFLEAKQFSGDIPSLGYFTVESRGAMPYHSRYMGVVLMDAKDSLGDA